MATQEETSKVELSPRKVAERLKDEGKQKLEEGKTTAAEQVDSVASALKSAGNELDQPRLATYANQLADSVSRFSTRLREGSVEDLVSDAQGMARRNPGLFILGGLAAGGATNASLGVWGRFSVASLAVRARPMATVA